jgi:hypothetical protein
MISLTSRLEHYLTVRRSLGYDLSTSQGVLCRFTAFADAEGASGWRSGADFDSAMRSLRGFISRCVRIRDIPAG